MNGSQLDRRIVIQSNTQTRDAYGALVDSWATFATVSAKYTPIRGDEYFSAQQMTAKIDAVFKIRYLSGVTTSMRISYDSQLWDIRSVNELGRRDGMELYAEVKRS